MLVGPSVGSLFAANAIWLIAGFAAGLTAVAGLVIMFVGLIRRGRAQRRLPPPPSGPIGTEPAWPPPAAGPASR
jgi:uncharacterized membrane protein YhiD involved in acid resistance